MLYIIFYSILFAWDRTYFTKGRNDSFAVVADVVSEEVDVQSRSGREPIVGIHQCPSFQVEILTVGSLSHSIYQSLLKVTCQNSLVIDVFTLGNVQQSVSDRLSVIFDDFLAHSLISRYFSRVVCTLRSFA